MDSYLEFVLERLSIAGKISAKAMFGGYGIYFGNYMFGIVADGVLYLKVGESNIKDYIQAGMKPFTFNAKNGKPISMSYWRLPVDVLESNEDLAKWAEKAIQIAKAVKPRIKIAKKIKVAASKKALVSKKKTITKKKSMVVKNKSAKKPAKKKSLSKKKK